MGDRIAVMRKGVLQQQGPPELLYDEPANLFVADVHRLARDEPLPRATRDGDALVLGTSADAAGGCALGEAEPRRLSTDVSSRSGSAPSTSATRARATRRCPGCRARCGSQRRCRPSGSSTRRSQLLLS